eukprot:CAMPEP_0170592350 /NCGR_PEP_ID=MMETSP0224-20130122/12878_1 /TAXON_ID=285029 /ORGANISM="Togula jolla, Strain CCCM 725" /LENGTH=537 /DNA_ID=CAMNT_0010916251 /DNA_START=36 /DNA_END=1650 /DNA_ORIENTATION=-
MAATDGFDLTQTQQFVLTQQKPVQAAALQEAQTILARLVSLTKPGTSYELRKDKMQVNVGRHPDCEVKVDDKRASAFHMKIYRDEAFRYFVQNLSANGCFVNDNIMKKGETRALQNGDEISICVPGPGYMDLFPAAERPFAAYIFRVADQETDTGRIATPSEDASMSRNTTLGRGGASVSFGFGEMPPASTCNSRYVTEQWVRENWDTKHVLGSGTSSEVRLGVHVSGGERRAVKVIDKKRFYQFQNKRESQLSLSSEANVLMSLNHSGIVRFYDWFQTDANLYLVMEFVSGGDLLQCILDGQNFTEVQARRLFRELCDSVSYLHAKNIVHRDLKPENILLTNKDRETMHPKIGDFGLARKNMESRDCRTFCGTPHYFAPEVINTFRLKDSPGDRAGYGKQADMWSLGVILYIMLSGIPPFEEEGLYEQILEGKYEFDVTEWNMVSPEAKELVRRLMTVNPKDRLTIEQALDHPWFRLVQYGDRSHMDMREPKSQGSKGGPDHHTRAQAQTGTSLASRRGSTLTWGRDRHAFFLHDY